MKQHISLFNYAVHNQGNDTLDINVDGYIVDAPTQEILKAFWGDETSVSFKSVRDQIKAANPKTINFIVNSGGGHVGDAMAIHDLIMELKGKGVIVNTKGTGIVASAATFLVMAGAENSSMTENSWFMIHNVGGGIWGDVNVVENYARMMRKFNDQITGFYSKTTGLSNTVLGNMMNSETWMTAQEAKDKGFVKNITGQENFTNKIKSEQWPFDNMAVLNTYNSFVKDPAVAKDPAQHTFFADLKNEFMKVVDSLKASITGAKTDKAFDKIENRDAILDMVEKVLKPVVDAIDAKIPEEEEVVEEKKDDKKEEKKADKKDVKKDDKVDNKDDKDTEEVTEEDPSEIEKLKIENKKLRDSIAAKKTNPKNETNDKAAALLSEVKVAYETE